MRFSTRAAVLTAAAAAAAMLAAPGMASTAAAAEPDQGGSLVATGHDLDFHCASEETLSCDYFRIVTQAVQSGSTLPILALDSGTQVADSVAASGLSNPVTTVDPTEPEFATTQFVSDGGMKLFSAIIVASDSTCGGCDNDRADAEAINTRSDDFRAYFNASGGIVAEAGADNRDIYYNFVPLEGISGVAVSAPFTVTERGEELGLTNEQANCCATHNSFTPPPAPLEVLEFDSEGQAETIAIFNATIDDGGFVPPPMIPEVPFAAVLPLAGLAIASLLWSVRSRQARVAG